MSETEPHNEFLELCAVSTSGQLTKDEQKRLQAHLAVCQSCRDALEEYEAVASRAIPAIAASEVPEDGDLEPGPGWSQERAEDDFLKRLAQEKRRKPGTFLSAAEVFPGSRHLPPFSSESTWRHVWMSYAAGILLFVTLSLYTYRIGFHHGTDIAKVAQPQPDMQERPSVEAQLSDAGHERQIARSQIEQRDQTIAELRRQLSQQSTAIDDLKIAQSRLEADVRADEASKQELGRQRTEIAQKLETAQSSSEALRQKLDSLSHQSSEETTRVKALEAKVDDLTGLLRDREAALNEKDELLAHDRDIRELMGARDLYIAEVHDVAGTGETQKAYGRLFYTKGKSLIFYAYDLDQQAALKRAGAFQAWGRRGPDRAQALNLGIFYEDNSSKKRWMLKCDDPKTLAQIDAVFVTVEPNGGSHKPSGKSLLFAYLKVDPNHP